VGYNELDGTILDNTRPKRVWVVWLFSWVNQILLQPQKIIFLKFVPVGGSELTKAIRIALEEYRLIERIYIRFYLKVH